MTNLTTAPDPVTRFQEILDEMERRGLQIPQVKVTRRNEAGQPIEDQQPSAGPGNFPADSNPNERLQSIADELASRGTIESRRAVQNLQQAGVHANTQVEAPPPYFESQAHGHAVQEMIPKSNLEAFNRGGSAQATKFPDDVEQQAFQFLDASDRGQIDLMKQAGDLGFRISDSEWERYQQVPPGQRDPVDYKAALFLANKMKEAGAPLQPFDLGGDTVKAQKSAQYLDQVRSGNAKFDEKKVDESLADVIQANAEFEQNVSADTIEQLPAPFRIARTFTSRATELLGEGIPMGVVQLLAAGGGVIEKGALNAMSATGLISPDEADQIKKRSSELRQAYVDTANQFNPGKLISEPRLEKVSMGGDTTQLFGKREDIQNGPGKFEPGAYLQRVQTKGSTGSRIANASAVLGAEIMTSILPGSKIGPEAVSAVKGVSGKIAEMSAEGTESLLRKVGLFAGKEEGTLARTITKEHNIRKLMGKYLPEGASAVEKKAIRLRNRKLANMAGKLSDTLNLNVHEGVGKFLGMEGTLAMMRVGTVAAQGVPQDQMYNVWAQTIADDPLLIRKLALNFGALVTGKKIAETDKMQPEDWIDVVLTPTFAGISLGVPEKVVNGIGRAIDASHVIRKSQKEKFKNWMAMRHLVRTMDGVDGFFDLENPETQRRLLRMAGKEGLTAKEIMLGVSEETVPSMRRPAGVEAEKNNQDQIQEYPETVDKKKLAQVEHLREMAASPSITGESALKIANKALTLESEAVMASGDPKALATLYRNVARRTGDSFARERAEIEAQAVEKSQDRGIVVDTIETKPIPGGGLLTANLMKDGSYSVQLLDQAGDTVAIEHAKSTEELAALWDFWQQREDVNKETGEVNIVEGGPSAKDTKRFEELPAKSQESIKHQGPLHPKVKELVFELNEAGYQTYSSGDSYGQRMKFVGVDARAAKGVQEAIDRDLLPYGWELIKPGVDSVKAFLKSHNRDLEDFDAEQIKQIDKLMPEGSMMLVNTASRAVDPVDARAVVNAVKQTKPIVKEYKAKPGDEFVAVGESGQFAMPGFESQVEAQEKVESHARWINKMEKRYGIPKTPMDKAVDAIQKIRDEVMKQALVTESVADEEGYDIHDIEAAQDNSADVEVSVLQSLPKFVDRWSDAGILFDLINERLFPEAFEEIDKRRTKTKGPSKRSEAPTTKEKAPSKQEESPSKPALPKGDTPAMQQYRSFKEKFPDTILFFRMGDFYETFDEDAVKAHKTLGITLTERSKGVKMAGVPFHSIEKSMRQMIEAGHRVAIVENVANKGESPDYQVGERGNKAPTAKEEAPSKPQLPAYEQKKIAKLRKLADGLTEKIEANRGPMTQNPTPKRTAQYKSRLFEADNMERTQKAMYALADGIENQNLPDGLNDKFAKLSDITANKVAPMVRKKLKGGGYYDVIPSDEYSLTDAESVALQQLIDAKKVTKEDLASKQARERELAREDFRHKKYPGFFPTPKPIVTKMLDLADIQATDRVLEPSAGLGDIADEAFKRSKNTYAVEHNYDMVSFLEKHGPGYQVVNTDFLKFDPSEESGVPKQFDKIVMNPPFEVVKGIGRQDISHVMKAWDLLAPGGTLVSIVSNGSLTSHGKQAKSFKAFVQEYGEITPLKDQAFGKAFRQTGVHTSLVVLKKAGGAAKSNTQFSVAEQMVSTKAMPKVIKPNDLAEYMARQTYEPSRFDMTPQEFDEDIEAETALHLGNMQMVNDADFNWVRVYIPLNRLTYTGELKGEGHTQLIKRYAERDTLPPPIVAGISADPNIASRDKFLVLDGKHRVAAARERGLHSIMAYVPETVAGLFEGTAAPIIKENQDAETKSDKQFQQEETTTEEQETPSAERSQPTPKEHPGDDQPVYIEPYEITYRDKSDQLVADEVAGFTLHWSDLNSIPEVYRNQPIIPSHADIPELAELLLTSAYEYEIYFNPVYSKGSNPQIYGSGSNDSLQNAAFAVMGKRIKAGLAPLMERAAATELKRRRSLLTKFDDPNAWLGGNKGIKVELWLTEPGVDGKLEYKHGKKTIVGTPEEIGEIIAKKMNEIAGKRFQGQHKLPHKKRKQNPPSMPRPYQESTSKTFYRHLSGKYFTDDARYLLDPVVMDDGSLLGYVNGPTAFLLGANKGYFGKDGYVLGSTPFSKKATRLTNIDNETKDFFSERFRKFTPGVSNDTRKIGRLIELSDLFTMVKQIRAISDDSEAPFVYIGENPDGSIGLSSRGNSAQGEVGVRDGFVEMAVVEPKALDEMIASMAKAGVTSVSLYEGKIDRLHALYLNAETFVYSNTKKYLPFNHAMGILVQLDMRESAKAFQDATKGVDDNTPNAITPEKNPQSQDQPTIEPHIPDDTPKPIEGAEDHHDRPLPASSHERGLTDRQIRNRLSGLLKAKKKIYESLITKTDLNTGKRLTNEQRARMADGLNEIDAEFNDLLDRYEKIYGLDARERMQAASRSVEQGVRPSDPAKPLPGLSNPDPTPKTGNPDPFINEPPETKQGKRLVHKLKNDPEGAKVGVRSILRLMLDTTRSRLRVGPEQTTRRHPAHYNPTYHIIRSKSPNGVFLLHEGGHAISAVLRDANPKWWQGVKKQLQALTWQEGGPGKYASAKSAEEGMAEFVRMYVQERDSIPPELVKEVMGRIKKEWPEMHATLRDIARAWHFHKQRSTRAQFRSYQEDVSPPPPIGERIGNSWASVLSYAVSAEAAIDHVHRKSFRALQQASNQIAREWDAKVSDSPADSRLAYQSLLNVPIEVSRALGGAEKGQAGIRIRVSDPGDMQRLIRSINRAKEIVVEAAEQNKPVSKGVRALVEAGFDVPDIESVPDFGEWMYLTDFSMQDVVHAVGSGKWDEFQNYGWMRALLSRGVEKGLVYPGKTDGITLSDLRQEVARYESENPGWSKEFKRVQKFMDQLLLVTLMSGEIDMPGLVRIQSAFPDYWPLPRNAERAMRGSSSGSGANPSAGIRRAFGSESPVKSVIEAVEDRVKKALGSYYQNRLMLSVVEAQHQLKNQRGANLLQKAPALSFMTYMNLEPKKVATLQPEEMAWVVADYMNVASLEEINSDFDSPKLRNIIEDIKAGKMHGKSKLEIVSNLVMDLTEGEIGWDYTQAENVDIEFPGRALYRARKPKGVRIVAPFKNGKRVFYQVEDPILYDFFAQSQDGAKFINWASKILLPLVRPWKRLLTQNIVFAFWNVAGRDVTNAMVLGDSPRSVIPGYYVAVGLINRLTGKTPDAIQQSELLSKALDTTTRVQHQSIVEDFKAVMAEDILMPGYRDMSVLDKMMALPGQVTSAVLKPVEMFLWMTGQRQFSQMTESLAREGAYIEAKRQGHSSELAQARYDHVTGNFGAHPSSSSLHSVYRMAGFLNPAVQILYGNYQRLTHVDPAKRTQAWLMRLPSVALYAATAAAINYLATPEEERKRMKERPDQDRMGYKALFGRFRMPFDYGLTGAVESFAWNAVESWLLEDDISGEARSHAILQRMLDLPGHPMAFMHPWIKTWIESEANYNFYFGNEIVPSWMKSAYPYNPELQTYPSTPQAYQLAGKYLKMSPIKLQAIVQGAFTSQVDETMKAVDVIMGDRTVFEPGDLPFIGRAFIKEPRGWRSASVKKVADAEVAYQNLLKLFSSAAMDPNTPDATIEKLQEQLYRVQEVHASYIQIKQVWAQVKLERKKDIPDNDLIKNLERRMMSIAQRALEQQKDQQ